MKSRRQYLIAVVVFAALAFLPLILSDYYTHIAILVLIWGFLATAWNILGGYGGQHSLGNGLFMGIGAYGAAYMSITYNLSPWISMIIFGIVAGLVGAFIGYLCFRYGLKGAYFALVTIALTEAAVYVASNWTAIGAANGLSLPIPEQSSLWQLSFVGKTGYYYIALLMMFLIIVFTIWLVKQRFGYRLVAVRENEDAAEALGVGTLSSKTYAIVVSAILTALGGVFYIAYIRYVDPRSVFGEVISVQILLYAIIGGLATVWGPLVGTAILLPLAEIIRGSSFGQTFQGAHLVTYGVILVLVMLFMPKGIVGAAMDLYGRFRSGELEEPPPTAVFPENLELESLQEDGLAPDEGGLKL